MASAPEDKYQDVFSSRYCSRSPLVKLLSERNRTETWRGLWCALARAEMECGVGRVEAAAVEAMDAAVTDIDWPFIRAKEAETRHDVMAHIAAFEKAAPKAKGIIHLGATSAFVQDNADVIITRDCLNVLIPKLVDVLRKLGKFAGAQAAAPTVGLTHLQPATLTTVGKRACLWTQDLLIATKEIVAYRHSMRLRGCQGATGSRASYMTLTGGDASKVEAVNARVVQLVTSAPNGALGCFDITGQTYTRMEDARLLNALALYAAAMHKMAQDIRILQSRGELMEPFGTTQVGSSAMPYKRNPMKCERMCALARLLIALPANALNTAAVQGFERTLDDSANRRVSLSEGLLCLEALVSTAQNVVGDLRVMEGRRERNVREELPFLALEPVLMALTQSGKDRQVAHEKIREAALKAHAEREAGKEVDLGAMLAGDDFFDSVRPDLVRLSTDPSTMIGDCPNQVKRFLEKELGPFLEPYKDVKADTIALTV